MALPVGSRHGPYEITAPLGQGGMGEVYKARDTRLERAVAIKVLPAALAADPQFRERFVHEARAISQLDHPHICTLYDVGMERLRPERGAGGKPGEAGPPSESERGWGPASSEEEVVHFLVMQYLEGETLAARLEGGAVPVDEALTIAIQIASALDKAHRAGITHRDLKPGNIFLCSRGAKAAPPARGRYADEGVTAKLLDFGLAKTAAPAAAVTGLSALPTTPPPLTAQGTILGTFQYMAPEQLEGKAADARTDIFAFGATLYEMLTGKKAFTGKSHASLISAIMSSDPSPIAASQPLTPPTLDHVVRRCLAKDPDERWQAASDVMRELKWIAEAPSPGVTMAPTVGRRSRDRAARTLLAAAVLALVALAVPTTWYFRRAAPEPVITRLDIVTPPTSDVFSYALSPDSRFLLYATQQDPKTASDCGLAVDRRTQALPGRADQL